MNDVIECLGALQKLQFRARPLSDQEQSSCTQLRSRLPESILANFDRFIARGKKAVAVARKGVCSECHLRIPSGTLANLACTSELHTCDNCGRFLYLPEDEPLGIIEPLTSQKLARRRGTKPDATPAR